MEQIYTVEEIASMLRVSNATVYRLLESGQLQGFKVGTQWRIKQSSLERFIEEQGKGEPVCAGW